MYHVKYIYMYTYYNIIWYILSYNTYIYILYGIHIYYMIYIYII